MKKGKNIKSKELKDSLLEYSDLNKNLKSCTESAVKDLLPEALSSEINKLIKESDDDIDDDDDLDDNSDKVEDTDLDAVKNADSAENADAESSDNADAEDNTDADVNKEDGDDEWANFDKYKLSDNEYDLSNADDDDVIKVFKKIGDGDEVVLKQNGDNIDISDGDTGAEYQIQFNDHDEDNVADNVGTTDDDADFEEGCQEEGCTNESADYGDDDINFDDEEDDDGINFDDEDSDDDEVNESRFYEITLDEDDNFEGADDIENESEDDAVEEATNVGGFVQQNSVSMSHVPNSKGRKARNSHKAGVPSTGTEQPRYSKVEENILAKANAIFKENKQLTEALVKFRKTLKEAVVTNCNLSQIIKILKENSTTDEEKKNIIKRFGKEATTIEESKKLYATISESLKKNNSANIIENISNDEINANSSKKINETRIYESKDTRKILDLMSRTC